RVGEQSSTVRRADNFRKDRFCDAQPKLRCEAGRAHNLQRALCCCCRYWDADGTNCDALWIRIGVQRIDRRLRRERGVNIVSIARERTSACQRRGHRAATTEDCHRLRIEEKWTGHETRTIRRGGENCA